MTGGGATCRHGPPRYRADSGGPLGTGSEVDSPIPLYKVRMPPRDVLLPRLDEVLYSGYIGEGKDVQAFEERFSAWLGVPAALACSSGTAALHLALILAGVGTGDRVVSTAMTAEPTNMAIRHAGAQPLFADIDERNGTVSADTVGPVLDEGVRAILAVDYAGIPVAMGPLRALADRHGLPIVEDAAQALGATWEGRWVGHLADFTVFSFQAIKHITTGDGGMLILRDAGLLPRARRLRWFGLERGVDRSLVDVSEVGFKYGMNNIAAAIGLAQMATADDVVASHVANGRAYDDAFANIPGIRPARWDDGAGPSYWVYSLLCDDREGVARRLTEMGVGWGLPHRRNDLHSVFRDQRRPLPFLDRYYRQVIHLPCGWWVGEEERRRVIDAVVAE